MSRVAVAAAVLAVTGVTLGAAPAAAQTVDGALDGIERPAAPGDPVRSAEIDQRTAEIGATLRCPICRQQSVAESSARIAREMQDVKRFVWCTSSGRPWFRMATSPSHGSPSSSSSHSPRIPNVS